MITLATAADLPRILALYAHARAFMAENGNPNQWGQTRPTEADVAAHIAARELYVLREEGEIHGVFAFILGEPNSPASPANHASGAKSVTAISAVTISM